MTKGATQIQMQALERLWEKFERAHDDMEQSDEADSKDSYFVDDKAEAVRDVFLERMGELQEHFNTFEAPTANVRTLNISPSPQQNSGTVLSNNSVPSMPMPLFNGDYLQWSSFRSLFTAYLASQNFCDVAKITFLRGCLKENALDVIVEQPVVEGNYDAIWKMLTDQYVNNRRVVTILIKEMFALKPMISESAAEVKRILKGINGPIATLRTLGRHVDKWDDFLVVLTVSKLDSKLRKGWETSLGDSNDPPKFETMVKFLKTKQTSLEAYEAGETDKGKNAKASSSKSSSNSSSQSKVVKNQAPAKSFVTSIGQSAPKCCCFKEHSVINCPKFQVKSVGERHAIIKRSRFCYNCLQKHKFGECKSQTVCGKCQMKHHELLHFERENSDNKADSSTRPPGDKTPQHSGNDKKLAGSSTHLRGYTTVATTKSRHFSRIFFSGMKRSIEIL